MGIVDVPILGQNGESNHVINSFHEMKYLYVHINQALKNFCIRLAYIMD